MASVRGPSEWKPVDIPAQDLELDSPRSSRSVVSRQFGMCRGASCRMFELFLKKFWTVFEGFSD
jgi:hypothetical protein